MLTERFEDALVYAARLHRGQTRKGGAIDYLAHLLATASIALEYGATEDEAIAALLHDAIEDQGGAPTRDAIRARFGDVVCAIVEGCSEFCDAPKPAWSLRKEGYLRRLPQMSASVRLVSAADKLHNARSLLREYRDHGEALWPRFTGGKERTLWFYRALTDIYLTHGPQALGQDLQRTLDALTALL